MRDKYAAAIEALKNELCDIDWDGTDKAREEVESAIRLLEAAGKVDYPRMLVQVMQDLTALLERDGRIVFVRWMKDAVLPLLEALPDGGKE